MKRVRIDIPPAVAGRARTDWLGRLTEAAFLLALVVVGARALAHEFLRDTFEVLPSSPFVPSAPGPAASLLMDLLCCLPAVLVLVRRAIDRAYVVRVAWSHLPMALLAGWMALSTLWAADRFAAFINAANFISALVLLWSMTQLVRSWLRMRIVAAVVFGLLAVYAAAGLEYGYIQHPELLRAFERDPEGYLRSQGIEPGSPQAALFISRLRSGSVGIFSASPNTYAAVMVLMLSMGVALVLHRLDHRQLAWVVPIVAVIVAAVVPLYRAGSLAAAVTCSLGVMFFALLWLMGTRAARRAAALYWLGVGAFVVGAAAMIAHGLFRGGLGVRTLTFRWHYWNGAMRMLADHPLAGVGWANFGQYYPQYRLPLAVEEVQDPHNLLVRFAAELGLVGLALAAAWLLRLWWELTRPVAPADTASSGAAGRLHRWLLVPLLIIALNALLTIDFSQTDVSLFGQLFGSGAISEGNAHVINEMFRRLCAFVLLMAAMGAALFRSFMEGGNVRPVLDDRPAPWLLRGAVIGAGLFLIHNLIDFALFETSALFVFAMVAGSAAGLRQPSAAGSRRRTPVARVALGGAAVAWLMLAAMFIETTGNRRYAAMGEQAARRGRLIEATSAYLAAAGRPDGWVPADSEYAFRAARAAISAGARPSLVFGALETAIRANPRSVRYHLLMAQHELTLEHPDSQIVRSAMQRAIELDPWSAALRIEYAQILEKLDDPRAAAEQYAIALRFDEQLPPDEQIRRLSPQQRQQLQERIAALSARATTSAAPPATAPPEAGR
jgi:O-antigen ligase